MPFGRRDRRLIRAITHGGEAARPAPARPPAPVVRGGGGQPGVAQPVAPAAAARFEPFPGEPPAGPVPCVDVLLPDFPDADGLAGEAIRARLETMTDAGPPGVFRFRSAQSGRAGFGVRLGPVADPQAFARKVHFGRTSVQGRRITVVDVRADPADLAEARAQRMAP